MQVNVEYFARNIEVETYELKRPVRSVRHRWEYNIQIENLSEEYVPVWTGLH